jgi:hypothetical protein
MGKFLKCHGKFLLDVFAIISRGCGAGQAKNAPSGADAVQEGQLAQVWRLPHQGVNIVIYFSHPKS